MPHHVCAHKPEGMIFIYNFFLLFFFCTIFVFFFQHFPSCWACRAAPPAFPPSFHVFLLAEKNFIGMGPLVLFANLILFNHSLLYLLLHGFQVLQLFFLLLFYFSRALLLELGGFFVVIKKQWNGVEQLKVVYKSGYRWFLVLPFFTIHNLHIIFNLMIYKFFSLRCI